MEKFTSLLNEFEEALNLKISQNESFSLNFHDLRKMNKIKNLMEEIKFLPELYEWDRTSRFESLIL